MSKITVQVQAFGYIGEDYEELEVNQEKELVKDLSDNALTEIDCISIVQSMVEKVKEIKLLFPDEVNPQDNKLVSIKFYIVCICADNTILELEEETFFNIAARYDSLANLLLEYIHVTEKGDEGTRIWIPENESYESHPAGTFAMLALVQRDKKWISTYINFLRTNDLDSEMMQMWHIKNIIETYDWCDETVQLAIARNVSCCGQGGCEQFNDFVLEGLYEYISNSDNRNRFIQYILNEFDGWDKLEFRLKDGSEKHYNNYIVSYVNHFKPVLTAEEIEQIDSHLWNKWKAYHAG